jgi:class 3 adenylate cyclase
MSATRLLALCLTDVESSSTLWREHPTVMPDAIAGLDAIVARATCDHNGTIVKSRGEGDSHFLVFPLVSDAVHASATMQRELGRAETSPGIPLRVRMAVHAGEVRAHAGDYLGLAINRTARLRSLAHGGQIVASTAVAELTSDLLDDALELVSLGRHGVRDFPGWTEVFQLCGPGLGRDFPPLVTDESGLPPIATIVMLDCVGASAAARQCGTNAFMGDLTAMFAAEVSAANGQYLKQMGDGCLGLFADPDHALAFVRAARDRAAALGVGLRGAVHVGRVEFVRHEPVGDALFEAVALLRAARRSGCNEVVLSATAALLVEPAGDLVTADA